MEEIELRERVAKNIAVYRKYCAMTQLELAEKLNYSDKSVSKWERGDGMPDPFVLYRMAELFGVTVDALLYADVENPAATAAAGAKHERMRRLIMTLLIVGLVWLGGTVLYFLVHLAMNFLSFHVSNPELLFLYCVPASFVVLIVFSHLWWKTLPRFLSVSGLVWTAPLSVYCTFGAHDTKYLFPICAVLQVLAALWFILRHYHPPKSK